jgi:hypothetical protein
VDVIKSRLTVPAGSGTATVTPGGLLTSSGVVVGTTAVTTEETLFTYDLPANTLVTTGRVIRVRATGRFGANANTKTVRLYFGTNAVVTLTGAHNNLGWCVESDVMRTAANTQVGTLGRAQVSTTMQLALPGSLVGQTETDAINIKVTGQNGTSSLNDVRVYSVTVELL